MMQPALPEHTHARTHLGAQQVEHSGVTRPLQHALLLHRGRHQVRGPRRRALQLPLQAVQDAQLRMSKVEVRQRRLQVLPQVLVGGVETRSLGSGSGGGGGGGARRHMRPPLPSTCAARCRQDREFEV